MKKILQVFSLGLILTGATSATVINPELPEAEKSKTYTKTYSLNSSDRIILDNSFGEMKIATWTRNQIKVDVIMTAKGATDQRAQEILDMISIDDAKKGPEVSFKTHIRNDNRHPDQPGDRRDQKDGDKNEKTGFKINYTVFLPDNMALDATNQFGAMIIGDYTGGSNISSKFGSLTAGKIAQCKKVSIEFGKGTIESMSNGKLTVSFSRVQVNRLNGDIDAHFNQAPGIKLNLDNNLKKLDINNNFSTVYLDAEKNLSANFSIKSSFGNFSNKTDFPVIKSNDKDDRFFSNNQQYSGKSGTGSIPVIIKSSFGHVTLGHDISFDVNEKGSRAKHDKA